MSVEQYNNKNIINDETNNTSKKSTTSKKIENFPKENADKKMGIFDKQKEKKENKNLQKEKNYEEENKIKIDYKNLKKKNSQNKPKNMDIINESINGTKLLEDFEILEYLKSGGTGSLCKAKSRKIKIEQNQALKFLFHKKNKNYKKGEKEFIEDHSEILIHKKLKHKNIPDIYGYYKIKDGSCIVMEFSKFGDLENFKKTIIKKIVLSETLLCFFSYQILEAILYIHTNKIIHMDIKKQNILVDEFLNVRLTDFSVSLNYKECQNKIELPRNGTGYYISPEVLDEKTIDVKDASKIDIYSFGVMLYICAFNNYPYELLNIESKDYFKIRKNIEEKELKFPEKPRTSRMFQNFVKKCLEKDIKKRYNIYEAMKDPWIKGHQFIEDEKERYCNGTKILMNMLVDNISEFNKWVRR